MGRGKGRGAGGFTWKVAGALCTRCRGHLGTETGVRCYDPCNGLWALSAPREVWAGCCQALCPDSDGDHDCLSVTGKVPTVHGLGHRSGHSAHDVGVRAGRPATTARTLGVGCGHKVLRGKGVGGTGE